MDIVARARQRLAEFKVANPELKEDAQEMYQLMLDEIEAGESPENEEELFYGALADLLTPDDEDDDY